MDMISIRKLSVESMVARPFFALISGERATGKSTLVRHIIEACQEPEYSMIVVFSPVTMYTDVVPMECMHSIEMERKLEQVVEEQKQKTGTGLLLVFDDCHRALKSETFKWCALNGKSCKISMVVTVQYPLYLPAEARAACDFSFCTNSVSNNVNERVYKAFFSCLPSFRHFHDVLRICSERYMFVVRDHSCTTLSWYKADTSTSLKRCTKRLQMIDEELMRVCWHPKRVLAWEEHGCLN